MDSLGWQNFANEQPFQSAGSRGITSNTVLYYFLSNLIFLVCGLTQYIFRKSISIWYPICYEEFPDLCSVANVSLFIIEDNLHGYYIHGENPYGFSEGSAEHLGMFLKYEEENKGKNRGFIKTQSKTKDFQEDYQCFEIYISPKFRK